MDIYHDRFILYMDIDICHGYKCERFNNHIIVINIHIMMANIIIHINLNNP